MAIVNTVGGVSTVIELQGDDLVTGTIQDCTPYVERTKALHREGMHGSSEMKHAAALPFVAVEAYCNATGITFDQWMSDPVHIKRMLNDPTLSDFRIWKGRV